MYLSIHVPQLVQIDKASRDLTWACAIKKPRGHNLQSFFLQKKGPGAFRKAKASTTSLPGVDYHSFGASKTRFRDS